MLTFLFFTVRKTKFHNNKIFFYIYSNAKFRGSNKITCFTETWILWFEVCINGVNRLQINRQIIIINRQTDQQQP